MLIPFSPPPGLNSDDTTFTADGRWADCSNIRFVNGKPQVLEGSVTAQTLTAGQAIVDIGVFQQTSGGIYVVIATANKLWAGPVGAAADETPASNWGSSNKACSFAQWGETILASPYNGRLFQWTPGAGDAVEIANAPDQIRSMVVSPERQVIALGCNEEVSTTFNARCIRGSDIEDETDWTTSATNNAFEHILDDTGGIVTGRFIGPYLAVLTTTSLWYGSFVGDPGQTYQFDLVQAGCGIVANRNAACVFNGVLYWIGQDLQLWSWAPGGSVTPVPCPISKDFRDNIVSIDVPARVDAIPHFGEVRISYTDARDSPTTITRYIAVNQEGHWSKGTLARAGMCTNQLAGNLAQQQESSAAAGYIAGNLNIIYYEEIPGASQTWHIQSADQYLDNSQRRMMIRGILPDFEDQGGDVSLTLYVRDRPQSSATTKGPHTLTTATTKKDFRASGKIMAVKLNGSTYTRLGKPMFDMVPTGLR